MPFLIDIPIISVVHRTTGLVYVKAEVALTFVPTGRSYPFLVDTGCAVTTIDEAVAATLGLPPGGSPVSVRGATAAGTGRMLPVRFRFSDEIDDGGTGQLSRPGLEVDSHWVVVPSGAKRVA
ncbi:MAG TPA: retropepsin-like aspartic protease, partial [Urbifossiella sp.]|nr:retropepsin-like aspartic protease [Urbifossiella sp.]